MITRLGQVGSALDMAIDHEDMIIHTGSFCGGIKAVSDPSRYIENVKDTFKYLEMARKEKKKFVFTSTWDEDSNPYVESKRVAERMILLWNRLYDVDYLIYKLPSIIGRGVVDCFLTTDDPIIDDRVLYFMSVDDVVCRIVNEIGEKNTIIDIEGERISVKLLWEILKYARRKLNGSSAGSTTG